MSERFLPYARQSVDSSDVRAVVRVLRSDWLTQGPEVRRFEEAFAKRCDAPYAVAVSSGTAGLHLACVAAGFSKGDEVITSPMTFVASSNAILYSGATPKFSDIDAETGNLDVEAARRAVTPKTKGAVPVHYAGLPCAPSPKRFWKRGARFAVIEDACHALGAEVRRDGRWRKVGSCSDSDMAVFSFHPVKHLTTGEGGMVTTRSKDLYRSLLLLRSHGITKDPGRFVHGGRTDPWRYEMQVLGFNYRMTDVQCALGLSQLKKLDGFVRRRRALAAVYDREFAPVDGVRVPTRFEDRRSSYHLYAVRIDFDGLGIRRADLMSQLRHRGIGTQVHYIPVTSQPYYRERFGFRPVDFPSAELFYRKELSLPLYSGMSESDARRVACRLKECLSNSARKP